MILINFFIFSRIIVWYSFEYPIFNRWLSQIFLSVPNLWHYEEPICYQICQFSSVYRLVLYFWVLYFRYILTIQQLISNWIFHLASFPSFCWISFKYLRILLSRIQLYHNSIFVEMIEDIFNFNSRYSLENFVFYFLRTKNILWKWWYYICYLK
jgi:hypothetical protein